MLQLKSIKTLPEKWKRGILTKPAWNLEYFVTLEQRPHQFMIQPVRMAKPNIKIFRRLGNYQRQVPDFAPGMGVS